MPLGIWTAFENKGLSEQGGNPQIKQEKICYNAFCSGEYKVHYINKYNGN